DDGSRWRGAGNRARNLPCQDIRPRGPLANRRDGRRQDAGVSLSGFPRRRVRGGCVGRVPAVCLTGLLMTQSIGFDVSHLLAGLVLVVRVLPVCEDPNNTATHS